MACHPDAVVWAIQSSLPGMETFFAPARCSFSLTGDVFTSADTAFAPTGEFITLVGGALTLIRGPPPLIGCGLAFIGGLLAHRERVLSCPQQGFPAHKLGFPLGQGLFALLEV
ncbi:hypothetical protein DFR70_11141 [Nocardia tenerifensis]|uniref:Uncharacterized protein n=1 Tax=Nocardia tenerifensis TaxID=228006 RepID=A0A318JSZ9_9NOCA|nr:hypothetical protein DFR70_11141 [Nocardia tenerifensis]